MVSLLGPLALAITYWFNACLAHNLYITFYSYKNTYPNRIKFYKIGSFVVIGVILIFSLMCHQGIRGSRPNNIFLADYYGDFYLGVIYLFGLITILYILHKLYYILKRKEADFTFTGEYYNKI